MVHVQSFEMFCLIINGLIEKDSFVGLYGTHEEKHAGLVVENNPPANTLSIHLLALTTCGQFYCHESIKFSESEKIEQAKLALTKLDITPAKLYVDSKTGTVNIK